MKHLILIAALALALLLPGCAKRTSLAYDAPELAQGEISATYSASEADVKKAFFSYMATVSPDTVIHARKAELLTFLFLAEEPSDYVDCGQFTVTLRGGAHPGSETFKAAQRSARFRMGAGANEDIAATRTASLAGVVSVIFTPLDEHRTKVNISVDYVLEAEITGSDTGTSSLKDSASFRTGAVGTSQGGSAAIKPENVSGSWGMQCVSNTRLEKAILTGINQQL